MRAGFQNVGTDMVAALRGSPSPLTPNSPETGGCGGVGGGLPARGQVLPPDHEIAVPCTMLCCGSACSGTAANGNQCGPSRSLEPEERLAAGGQPADGGTADRSGFFWPLLGEGSYTGREADARTPEQMMNGMAQERPRDGKTSGAPGGAESRQAWWRGRRAGVAGAQPNDQLARGAHERAIGTESGALPRQHGSAVVDRLLEDCRGGADDEHAGWRGRRAGVAGAQRSDQQAMGEHGGLIRIHERGGAQAATQRSGVLQEKEATPVNCITVHRSDYTLTSGCASGVRVRRAARKEGTEISRSERATAIWPLHSAISIQDVRVTRREFGAVVWQGITPIYCSSDLEDCITFLVGFVRNGWPLGGQVNLSGFISGAFLQRLDVWGKMSGDMKLRKEAMKKALREEMAKKEAQKQEARDEAAREEAQDLTRWEHDQVKQDKEKQERKAQHKRLQELKEAELAKATEQIQHLNEAMEELKVERGEMQDSTAKSMSTLVRQAGGSLVRGSVEDTKVYLQHMLDLARVKGAEEARLVMNLAPLTVTQMLAQQRTASQTQGGGQVIVVVSATENDSNLSMHEVVAFLQSMMPRMDKEAVKGITNTPMSATSGHIPKVFEAKIATSEVLTQEFLAKMKTRHVVIAGETCTLGFESSVTVRVQFSPQERQRLFSMQQICQMAGWTQDEFDMFLTDEVRTALKQSRSGMEDHLLVAGFQRQGRKQGVLKRLTAKDLPQMRISVANDQAKRDMSALALRISLGADSNDCLFSVDGYCQDVGQESKEVGVTAARERALVKAEKVLGKGRSMLNSVANLALSGLEVCNQGLEPDEAKTKLEPILEQLSGVVADTSGSSDITVMFAQPDLVKALQKVYKGESDQLLPRTWSNMLALTNDMKAEVDRRRDVLDELITVQIFHFPPIDRIWTVEAQDKTALREMNMQAEAAFWKLTMSMGISCIAVEPVTIVLDKLTWDVKSGIIIVVQSLQQLRAFDMKREQREEEPAEIFTVTGGNAAGKTNHPWLHAQLKQDKVDISALKAQVRMAAKTEGTQRVRMKILAAPNSVRVASEAKAAIKAHLLQSMLAGEGFWVPREYEGAGGALCKTIVKPAEGQVATKLSQFGLSQREYHIRNIHTQVTLSPEECDDSLALMGELDAANMAKPVEVNDEYVIYLIKPLAEELTRSKRDQEEWIERLSVGDSTRATLIEMAQSHLQLKLQAHAAGGVWLPWKEIEDDNASRIVGTLGGLKEHDKKAGTRWIDSIAASSALVAISAIQDDETPLRNAVRAILQKQDTQLAVFSGGDGVSLILFANTVFEDGLRTGAARPGFPLPEMEVGSAAFDEFAAQIGSTAQGRGMRWTGMSREEMQEARCWQFIEDKEVEAVLAAQWQETPSGQLKLTRAELDNLEERVGKSVGPFCVLRNTTGEQHGQPAFMVTPQGPGVVFIAASDADGHVPALEGVRAEWTKRLLEQQPDLGCFTWLKDLLDKKWPELLYGTAAARMINKMVSDEKAIAMRVRNVFVIILPETSRPIEAIASREGGCLPASWGVQFGPENQAAAAKLQGSIVTSVRRTPASTPLLTVLDKVLSAVRTASYDAVYDGVEEALRQMCVLPGMRLLREPMQHTLQYVGKNIPASTKVGSDAAVPDLRKLVPHPAMLDTRCAEIVQTAAETSGAQMRNVGKGLTCLLFVPAATSMDRAWPEQDPRFEKWDVMGGATIEDLDRLMAKRGRGQETEGSASTGGEPNAMDVDRSPGQDGLEQGNEKRAHTQTHADE